MNCGKDAEWENETQHACRPESKNMPSADGQQDFSPATAKS